MTLMELLTEIAKRRVAFATDQNGQLTIYSEGVPEYITLCMQRHKEAFIDLFEAWESPGFMKDIHECIEDFVKDLFAES